MINYLNDQLSIFQSFIFYFCHPCLFNEYLSTSFSVFDIMINLQIILLGASKAKNKIDYYLSLDSNLQTNTLVLYLHRYVRFEHPIAAIPILHAINFL